MVATPSFVAGANFPPEVLCGIARNRNYPDARPTTRAPGGSRQKAGRREPSMTIEIGIFHNGASDLKAVTTTDGVVVNDRSLEEVHESYRRVLVGQVRQGILADRLGYDYWF
jgi:hypothetical protein